MRPTRDWHRAARTLLLLCLLAPATAAPQEPDEDLGGRLVERVVFEGATQVREDALLDRLETQPTRCRGLLLVPVCWIHEWDIVAERHHFDPGALPRDELRVRVMYYRAGYRDTGVSSEVREQEGRVEVAFRVQEGPATIVESLDIRQTEEVLGDGEFGRAALPGEGEPLDLDRLE